MAISDVYRSYIPNKLHLLSTVTLPGSFEIHWVRKYLINFMGRVGIVNATVYKIEPVFTKSSAFQTVLIFGTA